MTPEQLVPTLETCKRLEAAGYAAESFFSFLYSESQNPIIVRTNTPNVTPSFAVKVLAPTLQELLEELPIWATIEKDIDPKNKIIYRIRIDNPNLDYIEPITHTNPAEAAALLYVELNKKGSE